MTDTVEVKVLRGYFDYLNTFEQELQDAYKLGWRVTLLTQGESKVVAIMEREPIE